MNAMVPRLQDIRLCSLINALNPFFFSKKLDNCYLLNKLLINLQVAEEAAAYMIHFVRVPNANAGIRPSILFLSMVKVVSRLVNIACINDDFAIACTWTLNILLETPVIVSRKVLKNFGGSLDLILLSNF